MREKLDQIDPSLALKLTQLTDQLVINNKVKEALEIEALAERFISYNQRSAKTESEYWKNTYFNAFLNDSFKVLRHMERSSSQKFILAVCDFIGSLIAATILATIGCIAFAILGSLIAPIVGTTLGVAAGISGLLFGAILGELMTDWVVNTLMDQVDSWTGKEVKAPTFFETNRIRKDSHDMAGVLLDFFETVKQVTGLNLNNNEEPNLGEEEESGFILT